MAEEIPLKYVTEAHSIEEVVEKMNRVARDLQAAGESWLQDFTIADIPYRWNGEEFVRVEV